MSKLTPDKIYNKFQNHHINKSTALQYFKSFIENYQFFNLRFDSLKFIEKLGLNGEENFKFLENLVVSDEHDSIRALSAKIIIEHYLDKSQSIISWVIKNDNLSSETLYNLYSTLKEDTSKKAQSLKQTIEEQSGYWYKEKFKINDKEALGLELLNRAIKRNLWSIGGPANYIIQYRFGEDREVIKTSKEHVVGLKIEGIADELDEKYFRFFPNLTELELIGGILSEFSNLAKLRKLRVSGDEHPMLGKISKLKGLEKLINLRNLNLSFNEITDIEDLENLVNLEDLNLSNNNISNKYQGKIRNSINLECLHTLTNLKYLDLSDNFISNLIGFEKLKKVKFLNLSQQKEDYKRNRLRKEDVIRLEAQLPHTIIDYS